MDDGGCHQHPNTLHQISQNVDERRPHAGVLVVAAALPLMPVGSVTVAVWNARLMQDQHHPAWDKFQSTGGKQAVEYAKPGAHKTHRMLTPTAQPEVISMMCPSTS